LVQTGFITLLPQVPIAPSNIAPLIVKCQCPEGLITPR
jgi:hypothetical protein